MSWFERVAEEAVQFENLETLTLDVCNKLAEYMPGSFTLRDLADAAREPLSQACAAKPREKKATAYLASLLACLRCESRIAGDVTGGDDAVKELALNVANVIAPVAAQNEGPNAAAELTEDMLQRSQRLLKRCQGLATPGIVVLEGLIKQAVSPVWLGDEVLFTLLACADETQTWPRPETKTTAERLLEQQLKNVPDAPTKEKFLTETVLQTYLRPLFSKSKPASVTASGRRAEYADGAANRGESMPDESALIKPWKYTDLRAVSAVGWAVREADSLLIAKHWPLFIPVLLTLVDDVTTSIRRRGLVILADFLHKVPDRTLHDTGLAKVFEDAIFPTLAFLPSLTPERESVELLNPAYGALRKLADKQPTAGKEGSRRKPKIILLDRMLREGVFMGYFHAKEHVRIVEVLCQQTMPILDEMGVHAVKHLKDLIPMLSAIMTDPFAPVAPATLLAAIQALQRVLANCWPRIPGSPWQDEIINALVLCWLHLDEHEQSPTGEVYIQLKQELLTTSKVLAALLKTSKSENEAATELSSHVAPLVAKEPRLAALFPPNSPDSSPAQA
ncbi:hypothetical protein VTI28DRAFT_2992 [Corynascus sepedonium]